jgi:site-specific recombinase XerD
MGVKQKEEINPGLPSNQRYLVRLHNSGNNWYLKTRVHGKYIHKSLKTQDLREARQIAVANPPDINRQSSATIKRALLDFLESRQQLIDAPTDEKSIRLNTFKTYKARVSALIEYFETLKIAKKETTSRTVGSLKESDFAGYRHWRERNGIMITTIKTEISQINTILGWLCDHEYISKRLVLKLPKVDTDKIRPANRLTTDAERKILDRTLNHLCQTGDDASQRNWNLYRLWLQWLEETFTRPHESRMLKMSDVKEKRVEGQLAVQFYTSTYTKTGKRLVYAASGVKSELVRLYRLWNVRITSDSPLFVLPSTNRSPSVTWFSDKWKQLIKESGLTVSSRELTQYSLRHEGINTLLTQGIPATKVADLAGHSLSVQQRIYKKYQLENDHSVLRRDDLANTSQAIDTGIDADIPFPWEIDQETGEWFPDNSLESVSE